MTTFTEKKMLSASTGRATNTEMNLRKTLSENARMRGYFLKAAMEASNEIPEEERPEFFPSWNENAVKSREYQDYLIWLHFSYATATCHVFVGEPLFDTLQATFEDKLAQISPNKTQTKGKGKGNAQHETRKGRSRGVYAGLDFSFDAKIPFWCKYISVHDWRHNIEVQQALKQESNAQTRMEEG
jgi:hypothetical protein